MYTRQNNSYLTEKANNLPKTIKFWPLFFSNSFKKLKFFLTLCKLLFKISICIVYCIFYVTYVTKKLLSFFSGFVALFLTFLKNLYLGVTLINVCTFLVLVPKWCVVFFLKCLVKYLALGKNYALVLKHSSESRDLCWMKLSK